MALGWTLNPVSGNLMKRGRTHRDPEEKHAKIKADWSPIARVLTIAHEALQTLSPGPLWFPLLLCVLSHSARATLPSKFLLLCVRLIPASSCFQLLLPFSSLLR